jgi:hypothetical protein
VASDSLLAGGNNRDAYKAQFVLAAVLESAKKGQEVKVAQG